MTSSFSNAKIANTAKIDLNLKIGFTIERNSESGRHLPAVLDPTPDYHAIRKGPARGRLMESRLMLAMLAILAFLAIE